MEKITTIVQFAVALMIIVGIHELGHLLFAKLFGIKVESYGIGMPPKIWKKQFGETEYYVGAIPLGGAVKLSGMIDESLDDQTITEPNSWDYRAKPAWQRLLVSLGGIIFNIILGFLIYTTINLFTKTFDIPRAEIIKHGIFTTALAKEVGFEDGDKILTINTKNYCNYNELLNLKNFRTLSYKIERNEKELNVNINEVFTKKIKQNLLNGEFFIGLRTPFVVKNILDKTKNGLFCLQSGDKIIAINDIKINYMNEFKNALQLHVSTLVNLHYLRNGQKLMTEVFVNADGTLGIEIAPIINCVEINSNFLDALINGKNQICHILIMNLKGIFALVTGKIAISKSLSGPIGIAKVFSGVFDFVKFCNIVAMLSVVIGAMNLLPLPALDGGHGLLLIYEMITRKKIAQNVLMGIQKIGMLLLFSLAVYTTINDVLKFFL